MASNEKVDPTEMPAWNAIELILRSQDTKFAAVDSLLQQFCYNIFSVLRLKILFKFTEPIAA